MAPDDAWLAIFGEAYEVYYRRYIWTWDPMYQFHIYVGTIMMGWLKDYVEDYDEYWDYIYGFDLACGEIQHSAKLKWIKILYALPAWLSFIFLVIFRALFLIGYTIIFYLVSI